MIFFYLLLGYLLFRFITGFVIPVFRTTKHVRQQFSQMNRDNAGPQPGARPNAGHSGTAAESGAPRSPDASKVGEYIDFEEVKD